MRQAANFGASGLLVILRDGFRLVSPVFWVSALGLLTALLLGGGTRQGLLSDGILQLSFVPIFCYGLTLLTTGGAPRHLRFALVFLALVVLAPLLQLIPLPPAIAVSLPYHAVLQELQQLSGQRPGWWPISMVPEATMQGALSLIVPVGLYLCCLRLNFRERRLLLILLIGFGFVSAALGLVQIAQGPASPFRFYENTNSSEAVGFFANRNHLSALLYVTWLLSVVWFVEKLNALLDAPAQIRNDGPLLLPTMALSFAVLVLLVAQLMARSRAGLALAGVAMLLSLFIAAPAASRGGWFTPRRIIGGALALMIVLSSQYALVRVLERFGHDPLEDARIVFAKRTYAAALAFLPSGAGVGTFVPVYGLFERPQDALLDTYANRAHNDVLEVFLELGVFGALLILVFSVWLIVRGWKLSKHGFNNASPIDRRLSLGAAAGLLLLMAHSLADYPLRTGALMAVFAVLTALLSEPIADTYETKIDVSRQPKLVREPADFKELHPERQPEILGGRDVKPAGPWGDDISWPEAWHRPPDRKK
jgi:O-antigen ligase